MMRDNSYLSIYHSISALYAEVHAFWDGVPLLFWLVVTKSWGKSYSLIVEFCKHCKRYISFILFWAGSDQPCFREANGPAYWGAGHSKSSVVLGFCGSFPVELQDFLTSILGAGSRNIFCFPLGEKRTEKNDSAAVLNHYDIPT